MKSKKMLSLAVSDTLREALRIEAFKRDCNVSALVRQILEENLKDAIKECAAREVKNKVVK